MSWKSGLKSGFQKLTLPDPQEDQLSLTVSNNSGTAQQQDWTRGVWD